MDLHKRFWKLFFSENIGFSGGFSNNINIRFQTLLMNSPTFHMLTLFSKYLYSQETSESREIMLSDGCSLFLNEPNNINFWKCNISNNVWHVNTTGCIMLMNGDECCLFHIYSMLWYSIESRQPPDVSAVWFGGVTLWHLF